MRWIVQHFLDVNRANWDDRAAAHAVRNGLGYGVQRYLDDPVGDVQRENVDRSRHEESDDSKRPDQQISCTEDVAK